MVLEANAHACVHDTFWLKSHPHPILLNQFQRLPWITFARPKYSNGNSVTAREPSEQISAALDAIASDYFCAGSSKKAERVVRKAFH